MNRWHLVTLCCLTSLLGAVASAPAQNVPIDYLETHSWLAVGHIDENGTVTPTGVPVQYQSNYDLGFTTGYTTGYESGLTTGVENGVYQGTSTGTADGYDAGWATTYQPAFDQAYAAHFPVGRQEGWSAGVLFGFDEGTEQAAELYGSAGCLTATIYGHGSFGSLDSFGGTLLVNGSSGWSNGTVTVTSLASIEFDWAAHYYRAGYKEGNTQGFSIGNAEGYALTYQPAYDAAFPLGFENGSQEGHATGLESGAYEGYSSGWNLGYGVGYDEGFAAGFDQVVFGEFTPPTYGWEVVNGGSFSQSASTPEPSSLLLLAIAASCGLLGHRRRES